MRYRIVHRRIQTVHAAPVPRRAAPDVRGDSVARRSIAGTTHTGMSGSRGHALERARDLRRNGSEAARSGPIQRTMRCFGPLRGQLHTIFAADHANLVAEIGLNGSP